MRTGEGVLKVKEVARSTLSIRELNLPAWPFAMSLPEARRVCKTATLSGKTLRLLRAVLKAFASYAQMPSACMGGERVVGLLLPFGSSRE